MPSSVQLLVFAQIRLVLASRNQNRSLQACKTQQLCIEEGTYLHVKEGVGTRVRGSTAS